MGFSVYRKAIPNEQTESGPIRVYQVEWDGFGATSTALAKNAVSSYLFNVVENQLTGEIRNLAEFPHGTPESPGALGPQELRTRYMLHGYPIQGIPIKEMDLTGHYYEATATYARYDNNAQAPEPFGAVYQITGNAEASIDSARTLSASIRARELDYAPLVGLLRRTPVDSQSDPNYFVPFPAGTINCERTSLKGRVAVNGLKLSAPPVDYTSTLTITGAYPLAAWVKLITDAAIIGTYNLDDFSIGGIVRKPGEVLLVSAEFEASANTTSRIEDGDYSVTSSTIGRMNLGFALGERKTLIVSDAPGGFPQQFISAVGDYVHTPSGEAEPVFYWEFPREPETETIVLGGSEAEAIYIGPFDYVWRFIEDEQVGANVISEVEWLSFHRPFAGAYFAPHDDEQGLFGTTGL
jgi:hypothetical protein